MKSMPEFAAFPAGAGPSGSWYLVSTRTEDAAAAEAAFTRHGGPGTRTRFTARGGYALVPAESGRDGLQLCHRLHARLAGPAWMSVGRCVGEELPETRRRVDDVLKLVVALTFSPGVYQPDDFPVEYAAARTPAVARPLRRLIGPVMTKPLLAETLAALIAEDGNRTRAAEHLGIHRSTIDYRLGQIEKLTGHSPLSARGLALLGAAAAAHILSEN